ncbi:MAG: T9SS type A sorting domain-containing protein, partial [Bacteroidetes bacterium]|nr:T9SS type A sorting domain-containing protein [Bacteroidota bacterium]
FCLSLSAQWTTQWNGCAANRGITQFCAINQNTVWAALNDPALITPVAEFTKTINGGTAWVQGFISDTGHYQLNAITALDQTLAWAVIANADGNGGYIMKTTNGGTSWVKQDSAVFHNSPKWIHFWDSDSGVAVGDPYQNRFEIFTTSNGGADWNKVGNNDIPVSIDEEYTIPGSFSVLGDSVFFGGATVGRVFVTADRGYHWSYIPVPLDDIKKVIFLDSLNGLVGNTTLVNLEWEFYKTVDGGKHWESFISNGPVHNSDIFFVPGTPDVWVSAGIGLSFSIDGADNWVNFSEPATNASPYYNTIVFTDPVHGWAGGINPASGVGGIYKYNGPALSIRDYSKIESGFVVFPNPANGIAQLSVNSTMSHNWKLKITDILGRNIREESLGNETGSFTRSIDLLGMKSGIYVVQLVSETEILQKELIVR